MSDVAVPVLGRVIEGLVGAHRCLVRAHALTHCPLLAHVVRLVVGAAVKGNGRGRVAIVRLDQLSRLWVPLAIVGCDRAEKSNISYIFSLATGS